jgi:hypothetical protein
MSCTWHFWYCWRRHTLIERSISMLGSYSGGIGRRITVWDWPKQKVRPYLKNNLKKKGIAQVVNQHLSGKQLQSPEFKPQYHQNFFKLLFFSFFLIVYTFTHMYIHLLICIYIYSYVYTLFEPPLPSAMPCTIPRPPPSIPLASKQNLFCPLLQFCWRADISNNKKDIVFLLA